MIKDEASSEEEEEEDEEGVNESKSKKNVKRNPKGKQKKDKRQRVENADEVAGWFFFGEFLLRLIKIFMLCFGNKK